MEYKEILRDEYRKTWETFSLRVKKVQELAPSADPTELEAAMRDADLAMTAHKKVRDNLAALLAPEKMMVPVAVFCSDWRRKKVQPIAAA